MRACDDILYLLASAHRNVMHLFFFMPFLSQSVDVNYEKRSKNKEIMEVSGNTGQNALFSFSRNAAWANFVYPKNSKIFTIFLHLFYSERQGNDLRGISSVRVCLWFLHLVFVASLLSFPLSLHYTSYQHASVDNVVLVIVIHPQLFHFDIRKTCHHFLYWKFWWYVTINFSFLLRVRVAIYITLTQFILSLLLNINF